MAARLPVADSANAVVRDVTSFHAGIIHGKSPAAVMSTTRDTPVRASSSCTYPACSNTTVVPAASMDFTSKSVNFVTCDRRRLRVSKAQTFETPSRSDRKYTASPTHTGSISFVPVNGVLSSAMDLRSTIQMGLFCPPR